MGHLAIINRKDGKVQSLRTVQADSRIFFKKGLSLKYANWGKNTTVRSMQNKILFLAVLFSLQLCSCFSHLLISVFSNLDGNYSSPTGCYEHLGDWENRRESRQPLVSSQKGKKPTNKLLGFFNAFGSVMCHSTVIYQTRSLLEHKIILKPENPGRLASGLNSYTCWLLYGKNLYFKLLE